MGSYNPAQYHQSAIANLADKTLFTGDAFINGVWTKTQDTFDVIEPCTETVLGNVQSCSLEHFKSAIQSADIEQKKYYASTTGAQRGSLLRAWASLIIANKKDLATILSLENGKTIAEADGEIIYATSFINWFAEEATRAYGVTIPSSTHNAQVLTLKEPVGVCGVITPWNFPAAMITRKIAPALAAGCAVVIKPPKETPYTCLALTKLAVDAGIPSKVIQVCPTKDREASLELVTSSLVKKISFTGSTGVGKMLANLATGTLKRVSLELGGNAPFIVFDDADLDLAVEGAMFCKFRCSGQTCVCANRIYVQRKIADQFTQKLVAQVAELKTGLSLEKSTTQGPLVNRNATAKVEAHIADALSKGAKIEIGGGTAEPGHGFYFQPTVLSNVTAEMILAKEETFGPLAPIITFESEEEVLERANDTEFGLSGYFFTKDISKAMRVAQKLQVGMIGINTGKISAAEAPFGGIKESGYGREGSLYGMDEYTYTKSITIGNLHI